MRKVVFVVLILAFAVISIAAQGSVAMAPARFELEMKPGTETTFVINLDFKADAAEKPMRIMASLNDWTMTKEGQVQFLPPNGRPDSASSWLIYSPGEATVMPGVQHQIRVTVSVPPNATPGDHLAALIVEQRPESLKLSQDRRQMVVRYRLATVFYIKVGELTRKGNFENLLAQASEDGVQITPFFNNEGNSVVRPLTSATILDESGKQVAELPEGEHLPILAGKNLAQPLLIEKSLSVGKYTLKYRVDFQDGRPATEGVTDFVVPTKIARSNTSPKKPD